MIANCTKIGVLFDLDGVLIDSERKYSLIWKRINEDFPTGIEHLESVIKGTTLPDILTRYYPDENIRKQVAERCVYEEANMVYDMCEGALELISALKNKGIPMAMVTSSDAVKMGHLWNQHPDLKGYFSTIIDAEKVVKSKPDPEGYLKAAAAIDAEPCNCIVFEDSYQGVKAGKSAGAFVIGIAGTVEKCRLEEYADIVIDSLLEVKVDRLITLINERR